MPRFRKIIASITITSLLFFPTIAHADFSSSISAGIIGCASGTLGTLAANGISKLLGGLKGVPTTNATLDNAKKCLDSAAYNVGKAMVADMTKSTLNWVNSGFAGNPLYTQDVGSYLKTIKNEKLKSFLTDVQTSNPIFGNDLRSIITQQVTGKSDGRLGKPMNTPEAQEYRSFMNDFTHGGWDSLLGITQNPNNNPIGAYFSAIDKVSTQIDTAQNQTTDEINRNNGFLDMKKCVEREPQRADGGLVACLATVDQKVSDYVKTCMASYGGGDKKTCTDKAMVLYEKDYNKCRNSNGYNGNSLAKCTKWQTVTPGSIIAEQVGFITNSSTRQAENIDSYNELLQSFFSKLFNKLLTKGLAGSRSSGGFTVSSEFGGPGANVVLGSDGNTINTQPDLGLSNLEDLAQKFDISRPQQLRKIVQDQYDFINIVRDIQTVMPRLTAQLGHLDYCFPGPNPTWQKGLDDNLANFSGSIEGSWRFFGFLHRFEYSLYNKVSGVQDTIPVLYRSDGSPKDIVYDVTRELAPIKQLYTAIYGGFDTINRFADAFKSTVQTDAEKNFAEGFTYDTYAQIQNLPDYIQSNGEIYDEYTNYLESTQQAITELESIRRSVNDIVGEAKDRYLKDRASRDEYIGTIAIDSTTGLLATADTPTANRKTISCMDYAYTIDRSAIIPQARVDTNEQSPVLLYSQQSRGYFDSLMKSIPIWR